MLLIMRPGAAREEKEVKDYLKQEQLIWKNVPEAAGRICIVGFDNGERGRQALSAQEKKAHIKMLSVFSGIIAVIEIKTPYKLASIVCRPDRPPRQCVKTDKNVVDFVPKRPAAVLSSHERRAVAATF